MNVTERERVAIAENVQRVRASVMDEVAARLAERRDPLEDGEFTTAMFSQHHGLPMDEAYKRLRAGAKAGLLTFRQVVIGRPVNAWRFSDNGSHHENGGSK